MPFQPSSAWLWHFDMLRDHVRNRAYREAIESAVREYARRCTGATAPPPLRVLDIGTGTGLLATLVARAAAAALPDGRAAASRSSRSRSCRPPRGSPRARSRARARVRLVRAHSTDARAGADRAVRCARGRAARHGAARRGRDRERARGRGPRGARGGGAPTLLRPGFASVPAAAASSRSSSRAARYRRIGWLLDDDELDPGGGAAPPRPARGASPRGIRWPARWRACSGTASAAVEHARYERDGAAALSPPVEVLAVDFEDPPAGGGVCAPPIELTPPPGSGRCRCDAIVVWWRARMGGGATIETAPGIARPRPLAAAVWPQRPRPRAAADAPSLRGRAARRGGGDDVWFALDELDDDAPATDARAKPPDRHRRRRRHSPCVRAASTPAIPRAHRMPERRDTPRGLRSLALAARAPRTRAHGRCCSSRRTGRRRSSSTRRRRRAAARRS